MTKFVVSLFCILLLVCTSAQAQLVKNVAPGTGTLAAAVAADTVGGAQNFPAGRVYHLTRGGIYLFNGNITTNGFKLTIVGDPPPATGNDPGPAFIQATSPGGSPDNLINAYGDLELRNVWVTSWAQGNAVQWQNISLNKLNSSLIIDSCIFDYSNGVSIILQGGHHNKYISRNTIYRNQVSTSQWWCGRPNYFNSSSVDSVWVENCTFVNEGFSFQEQDYGNAFFLWNHNTLINTAKFAMLNEIWKTAYVGNSIFYNSHFTGERLKQDAPGQDPDGYLYGAVIDVDTLNFRRGVGGGHSNDTLITDPTAQAALEASRNVRVAYNANGRDAYLDAFYTKYNTDKNAHLPAGEGTPGVDTALMAEPFVNVRTSNMFKTHPNMSFSHNFDKASPGFTLAPTNQDSLTAFLHAQFYATSVNVDWGWDGGTGATYQQHTFPWQANKTGFFYRTPENLTYSNNGLKTGAIGGFPMGDLNWYPTQKAAWMAAGGSTADITAMKALPAGFTAVLGIDQKPGAVPAQYSLEANYPNPFNPSTTIKYALSAAGVVKLVVYDLLGREVRTLVNGNMPAGNQSVQWDGKNANGSTVGSGVYFYKLTVGSFTATKKMTLLK